MLKKYIKNKVLRNLVEWVFAVAVAVAATLLFVNFIARTGTVFGESMEPTLSHNDIIIIDKLSYLFTNPKQGDIIAFPYKYDKSKHYIKRIIGVPGDIIEITDSAMYINGEEYDDEFFTEQYIVRGTVSYPFTVPSGSYFVMGDNRSRSEDSRYVEVGCVSESEMDGKVGIRVYPLNKLGGIK